MNAAVIRGGISVAALALLGAVPAAAQEKMLCVVDAQPPAACEAHFVTQDGVRTASFRIGEREIVFVGRARDGWWSGTLDGKPAMGFERNRGHVVFSTTDFSQRFAWYYPGSAHGSY